MSRLNPIVSKALVAVIACVLACAAAVPLKALADVRTNYSWYAGHESDSSYTIGTAGELKALAALVNGTADYDGDGALDAAVTFEGKTIALSEGLPVDFLGENIEPIGTAAHPFQGTFDGAARQIDNFKISIGADSAHGVRNIGLFGYVGARGALAGVSVGARSSLLIVRDASSQDYIENVGMVAGFCAGTMTNCSNAGSVSVESAVVQRSEDDYLPVGCVGGVAGQCVFDMTSCSNTGNVSVSETSSPVASFEHSQLAWCIGGVAGLLGDASRVGSYATHIFGEADKHGSMSECTNIGKVYVDTPKLSGLDRFGEQTNAESQFVGGVVGYSQGSVVNCVNGRERSAEQGSLGRDAGYVRAENGNMVGGVCGSLRGVKADNLNTAWADDGADGADPLVMSGCSNYGDVYGRVSVGGLAGKTSSYTSVVECLNQNKRDYFGNVVGTFIVATRWNKPAPAGIVGVANGEVAYCANFATVASAKWADEDVRTMTTQDGYYAAGIVGMLTYFGDRAATHKGGVATPISEVYSCYNAGAIVAGANMRQRGIVGENDGYAHDNVLVAGMVYNDEIVYGDDISETEASGSVGENRVYDAAELRSGKAAEAVAFMNSNSEANGWLRYWTASRDASGSALNEGYPLLNAQNPWEGATTSIAAADVKLAKDAAYTGGVSVPSATVTLNGAQLVEGADFRVVPQQGAIEPSQGKKYAATIIGLGRYEGAAASALPYDIVAGDFSTCSITVAAHTFDYESHLPGADEVTVRTSSGTTVPSGEYVYRLVDGNGDTITEAVDAGIYTVVAEPMEGSKLFTGSVRGTYRIKPASLMQDVKYDDVKITHLGKEYPWVDSTKAGESDNPSTTLSYTGVAVKPSVGEIAYKGHVLEEGVDYRIVYGNSNSDDGYPDDQDEYNMGKKGGSTIGCVTVRNITGRQSNFTSYSNMFFKIVDEGTACDLAYATYEVEGDQVSDGEPIEPVVLYLGRAKLVEGVDYTIEYRDNVAPGTATFTALGIGAFTGAKTGEFAIEEGNAYELSYEFAGTGQQGDPFEATVTGVTYLSGRERFNMVIPASVEHDGHDYAVTAIGEAAFGGRGAADFSGSDENASKLKIASVSVPATVRSIGAYAFGTSSITMPQTPPLSSVEIAFGSQLKSIGAYAFAKCKSLAGFTFPEQVEDIGDNAFYDCTSLAEVRFLATQTGLPKAVGAKTFGNCAGVVVRGYDEASAVKGLAEANSGDAAGANGGKMFTFEALKSLGSAVVSNVADQVYTGSPITPEPTVTLGGKRLTKDVDYTLSYEDNVHVGQARVIVRGMGDWGSLVACPFKIAAAPISSASFARLEDKRFDGRPASVSAVLIFNGKALKEGIDYTTSYADNEGAKIEAPAEAGTYRLVVNGTGDFTGLTYRMFRIVAASLEDAVFSNIGERAYTGAVIEPEVRARLGENELERDRDFIVSYSDNVEVGQATVRVFGTGDFAGQADLHFRIVAASLADAVVAGVSDVQADSNGAPVGFAPAVIVDGKLLVEGVDYELSYLSVGAGDGLDDAGAAGAGEGAGAGSDGGDGTLEGPPREAGSYQLVVTGKGSYTGVAEVPFSILDEPVAAKVDLSNAEVVLSQDTFSYDGSAHKPSATVKLEGVELREGADFVVSYAGNVKAGETGAARATVHGIGGYSGKAEASFTVEPSEITRECVADVAPMEYTGAQLRPHPLVRVGNRSLSEGVDFTVDYGENVSVGTGTLVIEGASGYTGKVGVEFSIFRADTEGADDAGNAGAPEGSGDLNDARPVSLAGAKVVLRKASAAYTGKKQAGEVASVELNGVAVPRGSYTVNAASGKRVGSYAVEVAGTGDYSGTALTTFKITKARNSIAAKATKSYRKAKLAKKARAFALPKPTFGTATYKLTSKDKSRVLSLNAKKGKVSVKKGAAKGAYTMKVKASVKGTGNYRKLSKIITVRVTVR